MNIVFAISEVEDLVKTGGLADVGKALPLALKKAGEQVSIVMPYYKAIAEPVSYTHLTLPTNREV